MAGIYNASITQRLNSLTDNKNITSKGEKLGLLYTRNDWHKIFLYTRIVIIEKSYYIRVMIVEKSLIFSKLHALELDLFSRTRVSVRFPNTNCFRA